MVIANDGFPAAQPQLADIILVARGERYTVPSARRPAWHPGLAMPHPARAENDTGLFRMVTAYIVKEA